MSSTPPLPVRDTNLGDNDSERSVDTSDDQGSNSLDDFLAPEDQETEEASGSQTQGFTDPSNEDQEHGVAQVHPDQHDSDPRGNSPDVTSVVAVLCAGR